jgi:hypothetical protein
MKHGRKELKVKKEIAEKWVADLRTNPPQAQGALFDGKGHCCLGRLCVILGYEFEKARLSNLSDSGYYVVKGTLDYGQLPLEVRDESGMNTCSGSFLIQGDNHSLGAMNDSGYSFATIADVIEQNWEKL